MSTIQLLGQLLFLQPLEEEKIQHPGALGFRTELQAFDLFAFCVSLFKATTKRIAHADELDKELCDG